MRKLTVLFLLLLGVMITVYAEKYIETAEATGGSNESIDAISDRALVVAKRQALERAGTVIQSKTEVKNFMLENDEIKAFAAGVTKVINVSNKDVSLDSAKKTITVTLTAEIEVDTAQITEYANALLSQIKKTDETPIDFSIQLIKRKTNSDGTYSFAVIPSDLPLKDGDEFRIQFSASKDVFVYIINEDQQGAMSLIYPHMDGTGIIRAQQTELLPDDENVFFVEGEKGKELLYVIVSITEMKDIGLLMKSLDGGADVKDILKKNIQKRAIKVTSSRKDTKNVTEIIRGKGAVMKVITLEHQ